MCCGKENYAYNILRDIKPSGTLFKNSSLHAQRLQVSGWSAVSPATMRCKEERQ